MAGSAAACAGTVNSLLVQLTALHFARRLAPVIDAGVLIADSSDLPRSVSMVTLIGHDLIAAHDAAIDRWRQNASMHDRTPGAVPRAKRAGTLRAIVGSTGVQSMHLDLRTQGPHALVGGTTGAGKSEFLQAWVLGMAAEYSPDRVAIFFGVETAWKRRGKGVGTAEWPARRAGARARPDRPGEARRRPRRSGWCGADSRAAAALARRIDVSVQPGAHRDPNGCCPRAGPGRRAHRAKKRPVCFLPDVDGHIGIYGTGGSGKSVALRTLVIAAGRTSAGGPVAVYGLDFAAGSLRMLEPLPHVGSIGGGDDIERIIRLFRLLKAELEARGNRFVEATASTIAEYRALANRPNELRILLLIDGFAAFREDWEVASGRSNWYDVFRSILADGRQLGIHVTFAADLASPRMALVVENLADFLQTPADAALVELIKHVMRSNHFLVADGETASWNSSWPLFAEMKNSRRGLLLQPDTIEGDILLKTPLPRLDRAEFPPGRGMMVAGGKVLRVQLPLVE